MTRNVHKICDLRTLSQDISIIGKGHLTLSESGRLALLKFAHFGRRETRVHI
jgi:hypothetical protein